MVDIGNRTSDCIEGISANLYIRIKAETKKMLCQQLVMIGVSESDAESMADECERKSFPPDSDGLCAYYHKGNNILELHMSKSMMGIDFLLPKLNKGEVS